MDKYSVYRGIGMYPHEECQNRIRGLETDIQEYEKIIATLRISEQAWMKQAEKYADALREIAEHPHCKTDEFWKEMEGEKYRPDKLWAVGYAEGHRCAAEIAKKALEDK